MAMALQKLRINLSVLKWVLGAGGAAAVVAFGFLFRHIWVPAAQDGLSSIYAIADEAEEEKVLEQPESLQLSPQARKNIGLATAPITLQSFDRTVSMPALVVERPGRSQIHVTAPLGGQVTRVYPIQGQAISPGQPLFDLRLTHEELVSAQTEFLRAAEQLDVENSEIKRLNSATIPGAIAGKTIRQHQYEKQKLEAQLSVEGQSLVLHGMTTEQVQQILADRKLVQGLTVYAPDHPKNGGDHPGHPFHVQDLKVKPGQYVMAGETLCVIADHHTLYVEGRAFEQDIEELSNVVKNDRSITAVLSTSGEKPKRVDGLKIFYLSDGVDPESRAFHFYLQLPNEIVRDTTDAQDHQFVAWKFRPGQRMQLLIPVAQWSDRIVLPVDAVAKEGAEYYVFQQNGDHFDRVAVHVEYQDQFSSVIANDGSVFPGDIVATSGAQQMQMALKNMAGSGVDPHAGHNH